ncbi:hypothetical protein L1049_011388 [Liquidambar formosana]|uniref:Mediator of RNA polymerase II transcription subunit 15a-like n=1 Tax=Liquidambar formosana TaxID=63359 RepID=A0AAP0RW76_LIQFO
MPPVTGLTPSPMPNGAGQNSTLQSISGYSQNSVGNSEGQEVPSNVIVDSSSLVQGRQTSQQLSRQHQQQSQNQQRQQQVQHQLLEQKFKKGNISHSLMQTHAQQMQQNLLKPTQLQSSQQSVMQASSVMQPPVTQSSSLPDIPLKQQISVRNSTQSVLRQHTQSVLRQQQQQQHQKASVTYQQRTPPMLQQPILPSQQLKLMGLQPTTNIKQNQLVGKQASGIQQQQQPKVAVQEQTQQTASSLLPFEGQQPQPQQPEQQLLSQSRLLPAKLQQQLNPLQQDKQKRIQTSADSTSEKGCPNVHDWQQQAYQKIKSMRDKYLKELIEIYRKIAAKLQQHCSLPHHPKTNPCEKLKNSKLELERIIMLLRVSTSRISPAFLERLDDCERWIIKFINSNRPRKTVSLLHQGQQLPMPDTGSLQYSLEPKSQTCRVKPHEEQMNPNLQMNLTTAQQEQAKMDSEQGNAPKSLQLVAMGSLQIPVSAPQQSDNNTLLSPTNVNVPQPNVKLLKSNSKVLQHISMRQQKEQPMSRTQQVKQQFKHCQMQQQQFTQLWAHNILQQQMNEVDDFKVKQWNSVESQCHPEDSLLYQQLMPGVSNPKPQPLEAASPQNPQSSSLQIDQPNVLTSLIKSETPLQFANSPSVVPSSTPLAQSSFPGDSGTVISGVSSLSNARIIGQQQSSGALPPVASLVISTPGMSASPLLEESNCQGGNLGDVSRVIIGKPSVFEQPLGCLINLVQSLSPKALHASVSDIGSVVSLSDEIAASAPGDGSRAAVGEDLGAITKARLQRRNFTGRKGSTGTRRMRRYASATPMNIISSAGSIDDRFKELTDLEASDLESSETSRIKRPRIEANDALLKEIREINQLLIDSVVDISDQDVNPTAAAAATEGSNGTIVKCSFSSLALSPNLKSQHASLPTPPILPLRLLVPTNYPNCSPIFLDMFPVEVSEESEDLSVKAKSKLSISLRGLLQPISLGEIARTWDICARAVISEYAQQSGGGNFSSKYGTWENCLTAV